jgi:hypothetical protein
LGREEVGKVNWGRGWNNKKPAGCDHSNTIKTIGTYYMDLIEWVDGHR